MRVPPFLLIMAGSLAVTGCLGETRYAKYPGPFDAGKWHAAKGDDRCNMVDDLRERIGLDGKTRAEVTGLLGEPESHDGSLDHYYLCPSFMDVWILEVHWEDGRVASTRIRDT